MSRKKIVDGLLGLLLIFALVTFAFHLFFLTKKSTIIISDPVIIYPDGTTFVIKVGSTFSYSGATGIISQKELLKRLDITSTTFLNVE